MFFTGQLGLKEAPFTEAHDLETCNKIHETVLVVSARIAEMREVVQLQCSSIDRDSNLCWIEMNVIKLQAEEIYLSFLLHVHALTR